MKRLIPALLLIALGWNAALALSSYAVRLPILLAAPAASSCPDFPLLDQDTGLIAAGMDRNGAYILAYQDRAHGSRAHVVQHVGTHLVELDALPAGVQLEALPSFSPPGVKQGALALALANREGLHDRLYFTQRKPDDPTGPYGLWCVEFGTAGGAVLKQSGTVPTPAGPSLP